MKASSQAALAIESKVSKSTEFSRRHIGPNESEQIAMLSSLDVSSIDELIEKTVPASILIPEGSLDLKAPVSERDALKELKEIAKKNRLTKSYLGLGYYHCITPAVIQRNLFENPAWYTQYTPYQAEISQGRLESLINFQTMICDLTGMEVANASVLDESTAAAEAMSLCDAIKNSDPEQQRVFFVSEECFPQTIALIKARAKPRNIEVVVGNHKAWNFSKSCFGALLQYPSVNGEIHDYRDFAKKVHDQNGAVIMAADLLSLTLLQAPGEIGADIAVGSAQRFGVPLGYGGPHAGYFAAREEYTRRLPGRIIGVSKDSQNSQAYRLSLQTREQHIRREKATSNICTAQALLANMAAMYAVYHGPKGLRKIAEDVHTRTGQLCETLKKQGHRVLNKFYFDTVAIELKDGLATDVIDYAARRDINLRKVSDRVIAVSIDETTTESDICDLADCFSKGRSASIESSTVASLPEGLVRKSAILTHPIFNSHHSETQLMRYIQRLSSKDLSLTTSMIPLGSCTMKLNAAAELMPVSWSEFATIHPFAPLEQARGYQQMIRELESMLCIATGFDAVSLQPNSGAQGEYAGLLVVQAYHESRGESRRNVCLITSSAHGTNPASAAMAGMQVVVIACDQDGNVDIDDLRAKAKTHQEKLSALMITYPSTHGVFEESIREICDIAHAHGAQVYMDGANMNAQVGLCLPGGFGPDVCHLNLHKTFCIPHGGGGPGVGPIGVKKHLKPFLPSHPIVDMETGNKLGPVSAAPWGSASILPISWMYIRMMGNVGLRAASQVAILNANYIAKRLDPHFPILYRGKNGFVAHECIIDLRGLQKSSGITVEDVAKRLMDFGFHAPTMAWPVAGTMMIEPTESESKDELDRFCEALITIRTEIKEIEEGKTDRENNLLKNAPHTASMVISDHWTKPYTREQAAFPLPWVRGQKFWPSVGRIDNAFGDRNFVCTCPSIESYE
jgi:glycine dehydrogenase